MKGFRNILAVFLIIVSIVIWITAILFSAVEEMDYSSMTGEISCIFATVGILVLLSTLDPDKES